MTEDVNTPAGFWARSKKATAAGVAGAITTGGAAFGVAAADGNFNTADIWITLAAVVGGFAVAFGTTWGAPKNAE